jgi:hypothetical protein
MPFGPPPYLALLQALALVTNPKLGLQHKSLHVQETRHNKSLVKQTLQSSISKSHLQASRLEQSLKATQ